MDLLKNLILRIENFNKYCIYGKNKNWDVLTQYKQLYGEFLKKIWINQENVEEYNYFLSIIVVI